MFGHSTGPTTGEFLFDAKASKFGKEDAEAEEVNNIASAVGQIGLIVGVSNKSLIQKRFQNQERICVDQNQSQGGDIS